MDGRPEHRVLQAGFASADVQRAGQRGAVSVEQGLYEVFHTDSRAVKLRDVAGRPTDLASAALHVFGTSTPEALERLAGLVSVCSLAQMPGSDAPGAVPLPHVRSRPERRLCRPGARRRH